MRKLAILILLIMTSIVYSLPFKPVLMFNHTTQLPSTTVALWWEGNHFQWEPSCFDAGVYRPTFSSGSQVETITITVNDVCDGTLEQFCERWLNPSANFKHYALWISRYENKNK